MVPILRDRSRASLRPVADAVRRTLFPDHRAEDRTRAWTGGLVFLVAVVVSILRLPPRQIDGIWAEDGRVFLQDAVDGGFWQTIFSSYSGYMHLYPRLSAELAAALPLTWAGVVLSSCAAVAVGIAAWSVWCFGEALLPSPWVRGFLAAFVAVVPVGALEAVDNVANSHFYLLIAALWAMLANGTTRPRAALAISVILLATLSDPTALLLAPVVLVRMVLLRGRQAWAVTIAYAVGMTTQILIALSAERTTSSTTSSLIDIGYGYAQRVALQPFLGLEGTGWLMRMAGAVGVVILAGAVFLGFVVLSVLLRGGLLAWLALAASVGFFAFASVVALSIPFPPTGPARDDLVVSSRYALVPCVLLLSAVALMVQAAVARGRSTLAAVVALIVAAPVAAVMVMDHRADADLRAGSPSWSREVADGREACTTEQIVRPPALPIAPGGAWAVTLDCSDLLR